MISNFPSRKVASEANPNLVEETYRQILDFSPDFIFVQVNNWIVYANEAGLKLLGENSASQFSHRSFFDFLHPDSRLLLKTHFKPDISNREPIGPFEHQILTLDGEAVEVETTVSPLLWMGVEALQIRGRHITLRTQFEIKLRESEAKFHQLADAMPQIVWMASADGKIDYQNKKFFEQTGLTEAQAESEQVWYLVLHPEDAPKAHASWKQSVRTGEPFQMECRFKIPSVGFRWHLGRALPVKNDQGEVIRWFGTCTDIHDQKLTEIALQEAKEQLGRNAAQLERLVTERTIELEETVRSSEALNYSIAHDLRAPLRAMMGFSHALLEEYSPALDQTGQEYVGRIAGGALRMDNLISALLAYGRLNYEELAFGFINTQSLMEQVLEELQPEIEKEAAKVVLIKPLPNVWANEPVLKRILIELFENALKFHQPEEVPKVEIWAEDHETKSVIWIRDNGIGIPAEHHQRIFRVLESLHVGKKYPGTGIGLAIAMRGVERLGGRIGLQSVPGQGSNFWIEIPKAHF